MSFLLDTDTFTHLWRGHPAVVENTKRTAAAGESIGTTIITKIEVLRGWIDLLIGSIVLAHNAILVTRNLKDFRLISRLKCVNWVD